MKEVKANFLVIRASDVLCREVSAHALSSWTHSWARTRTKAVWSRLGMALTLVLFLNQAFDVFSSFACLETRCQSTRTSEHVVAMSLQHQWGHWLARAHHWREARRTRLGVFACIGNEVTLALLKLLLNVGATAGARLGCDRA